MKWLLSRLSEPSTYAGLGLFLTQVAGAVSGDPAAIAGVIASVIAIVKKEKVGSTAWGNNEPYIK